MNTFFSKCNQVYPVLWDGRAVVEKHFDDIADWQTESALYAELSGRLPLPAVLGQSPGLLITAYHPGDTLLAELQRQETSGFFPAPWRALAGWLRKCHQLCKKLPADGNLRNYLWHEQTVIGLDLESFRPMDLSVCGAELIARLLAYEPVGTYAKRAAAAVLAERLGVSKTTIEDAAKRLRTRRKKRRTHDISGIILAGGRSTRMGQDKAALTLNGQPLLQWQIQKLRILGIDDIMISGTSASANTRQIPDIYPDRGPLGGLHACLQEAQHPRCLVLGVDTPLVPVSALAHLCRLHQQGVTVLECRSHQEPLIGVYDSHLSSAIEPLIVDYGAPVWTLEHQTTWHTFSYRGPEIFLKNCNTPRDYAAICDTIDSYTGCGITLF